jgi:Replication protein A C terminal
VKPALRARAMELCVDNIILSNEGDQLPHVSTGVCDGVRAYLHQKSFLGGVSIEVLARQFPGVPEAMILNAVEQLAGEGLVIITGDACGVYVTMTGSGGAGR